MFKTVGRVVGKGVKKIRSISVRNLGTLCGEFKAGFQSGLAGEDNINLSPRLTKFKEDFKIGYDSILENDNDD